MKKAMELSILCDCEIALVILTADKLFTYASHSMENVMRRYRAFDGPYEALTNETVTIHTTQNTILKIIHHHAVLGQQLK